MNTILPEQQKRPLRLIGIGLGLLTAIVIISWLAINIVNAVSGSFASLASLAESVRTFDRTDNQPPASNNSLSVTSDTNVVASGESVRLAWSETTTPGSYVFSYQCNDGVAIDLADTAGVRSLSCDTNYNLGNVTSATLTIDSTKNRYVDVPYTVSFLATNATTPTATDEATITVVNNTIAVLPTPETPTEEPVTPAPTTPTTPTTPTYTTEYTYTIPVSDPNGRTDLSVRYLNIGQIVNDTFVAGNTASNGSGAFQFEVKNLGTKTSGTWTYSATLPSGGRYESTPQAALKPNERAVITIGYPEPTLTTHTFTVEVKTTGDTAVLNNQFSQTVRIKN